ncbi:pimeloyl-ACP methyl ester esterase BioH [Psychromonas sp. MME2]|uniref:pimeloyl-ACP methyl ester esterase BioH n=1 Tax=unclassified Psychromonas TaxID=2614957 RepID=UPI00339D1E0D
MSIEQTVYCRVVGEGDDLVLLHGWGVNSLVWEPVIATLSRHFRLHLIDLPGFGQSQCMEKYSLTAIVERILLHVPERANWCGWSLGGLIATYASYAHPQRVKKIIQVCSSPKFVEDANWSGVDRGVFESFQSSLQKNSSKTLSRFIAIQAMGCATARQDTLFLKKLLIDNWQSDENALSAGLVLLEETDLRVQFSQIKIPCLSIFGQFDSLLPQSAHLNIHQLLPNSVQQVFENSAHAPFVSEDEKFSESIIAFLSD